MALKITECDSRAFGKMILFPFINGLVTIAALLVCKTFLGSIGMFEFVVLMLLGIITTLGITYLFDKMFNYGGLLLIRDFYSNLKKERGI